MSADHGYDAFPAAHDPGGHAVAWTTWDGTFREDTVVRWENEGFTVQGRVARERVEYVVRLSPVWETRQLLLFRDLDEPDLWLVTDGRGRWAEQSGTRRPELDGCRDVELTCTPFTTCLPIRRLGTAVGAQIAVAVVQVAPDTLDARVVARRYTRLAAHRWRREDLDGEGSIEFDVDAHGLVVDLPGAFRRTPVAG